jgi:hypothetical protein
MHDRANNAMTLKASWLGRADARRLAVSCFAQILICKPRILQYGY